jgi:hypothetical protein
MELTNRAEVPQGESFAAACSLEFDHKLLQPQDIEAFEDRVHAAIAVCSRVLRDEFKAPAVNSQLSSA